MMIIENDNTLPNQSTPTSDTTTDNLPVQNTFSKPPRFKGQAKFCLGIEGNEHSFGDWQEVFIDYPSSCGKAKGLITYERRCLICFKNFFRTE